MPTPHIITLLQAALDIPDEQAINKRNMGVPYAIVCDHDGSYTVAIHAAERNGFTAKVIGTIKKQEMTGFE